MGASAIESDMKPQPATSPVTSAPDGSAGGIVAVVLAGGDRGDSLAASGGVAAKALLPVAGQPMGAYVLRALRDCEAVGRIVYVGPTEGRLSGLIDTELASADGRECSPDAAIPQVLEGDLVLIPVKAKVQDVA